jgi:hypothetical protein
MIILLAFGLLYSWHNRGVFMRVQKIFILSSMAIALSSCGQINNIPKTSTSSATSTSDLSSIYSPATSTTTTTTTDGSSAISGSTSSAAPTIASSATNGSTNTVGMGSNITFEAPFQPDSSITYQWYKNGNPINGATSAEYSLSSIAAADYAVYTVKATNSMGSTTSAGFYVNPIVVLSTLGSHDCNGSQCWNDSVTADQVCKLRNGSQSVIANQYAYGPAYVKWTTSFCQWTGSAWSCQSDCTYNCSGYNVLGYVYCYQ